MNALDYTRELVTFDSTSCYSNVAVSDCIEAHMRRLGFVTERVEYDDLHGIRKVNVIGRKGKGTGGIGFFAHSDVVPAREWHTDVRGPFDPHVENDRLYGRGSCDMKGPLGCMLAAAGRFSEAQLDQPIYLTVTADEEVGLAGAVQTAARSELYAEMKAGGTPGIIGEPTQLRVIYAHKGGYGMKVISRGRAAHSSTREGINANLKMIPFLAEVKKIHDETETDPRWQNSEFNPPVVSFNIGINDYTYAVNITPPQSVCTIYFRVMPKMDGEGLFERIKSLIDKHGLELEMIFQTQPLYVDPQSEFVQQVVQIAREDRPRTVSYGTDGAAFSDLKNLVVCGPGNIAQAHTVDEWIALEQLDKGTDLFCRLIEHYCC